VTTPSGPGPYSQRTDRQPRADLPNADYGEQQSFQDLQAAAPMAADSGMAAAAQGGGGPDLSGLVGLGEPSQRPGEDVMTGVGAPAVNYAQEDIANRQAWLPALTFMANQQGASWAFRNAVRKLQAG